MTQEHPITPPTELVQQWRVEAANRQYVSLEFDEYIAEEAAQWGADQELLACGNYLKQCAAWKEKGVTEFYNYRRPRSLSLKEQALEALRHAPGPDYPNPITLLTADEHALIRRALEQLDD
jgi:hypothetical protein